MAENSKIEVMQTEQLKYVQECIERAKLLPVWDNVPSSLHAELDNIFRGVAHLAQRQDNPPASIPTEQGIYAWLNEYSAALVMVNKRPSDCSPGGILNGHVMESTKFYDGCQVEYWTGGKWFGPLTAQPAQRQDNEQSRLMLADDTSPRIPQRPDSDKAEQAAMYQWIRSNVSEDMQWYLFGHVVNSPEDFDKAIRAAIAKGTES